MSWQAVTLILGLYGISLAAFTAAFCVAAYTSSAEKRCETIFAGRARPASPEPPARLELVE